MARRLFLIAAIIITISFPIANVTSFQLRFSLPSLHNTKRYERPHVMLLPSSCPSRIKQQLKIMTPSQRRQNITVMMTTGFFNHDRREAMVKCRNEFLSFWGTVSIIHAGPGVAVAAEEVEDTSEIPECRNGAITPEYEVPGAYQNICMSQPFRTITLKSNGETITVQQNLGTSQILTGQTGMSVWNSSLLLTRIMDTLSSLSYSSVEGAQQLQSSSPSSFFKNKIVMELGCGAGLASITAAKLGASRVIATDGNSDILCLTLQNVNRNLSSLPSIVEVQELKWGLLSCADYYDTVDVVVGSDLTYNSASWKVLAETVSAVTKPGGLFLYIAGGHSGTSLEGEADGFRIVAEGEGLKLVNGNGNRDKVFWDGIWERSVNVVEREIVRKAGGAKVMVFKRV